jgi:hypothetical protein
MPPVKKSATILSEGNYIADIKEAFYKFLHMPPVT